MQLWYDNNYLIIVVAVGVPLFYPKTKTHFEDTLNEDEIPDEAELLYFPKTHFEHTLNFI